MEGKEEEIEKDERKRGNKNEKTLEINLRIFSFILFLLPHLTFYIITA